MKNLVFILFPTLLFAQEQTIDYSAMANLFIEWQENNIQFDGEPVIPDGAEIITSMSWVPVPGANLVVLDTLGVDQSQFNWRALVMVIDDTTILEPDTLVFRRIAKGNAPTIFRVVKETPAMYRLLNNRGQLQRVYNVTDPEEILAVAKFRKNKAAIENRLKEKKDKKDKKDKKVK